MMLVVIEVALVTFICIVIVPSAIVKLAAVLLEHDRVELPIARVIRK